MFRFLKKLFGLSEKEAQESENQERVIPQEETMEDQPIVELTPEPGIKERQESMGPRKRLSRETQLTLSSKDLMKMARNLTVKGEYYRAEQLIRDGVKEEVNNADIWWLLLEIEEPLNRKGRAYYCVEQIIQMDPENEQALEKLAELKPYIDDQLNYFIEYKMAPEFYRLK